MPGLGKHARTFRYQRPAFQPIFGLLERRLVRLGRWIQVEHSLPHHSQPRSLLLPPAAGKYDFST